MKGKPIGEEIGIKRYMIVYKGIANRIIRLALIGTFFFLNSCKTSDLFKQKYLSDNIRVSVFNDVTKRTNFAQKECNCEVNFEQIIELSIPSKDSIMDVREYYGEEIVAIGKKKNGTKVDLWKTYCQKELIAEELWYNGYIVWYRFFDENGKQIQKVYYGIEEEDN